MGRAPQLSRVKTNEERGQARVDTTEWTRLSHGPGVFSSGKELRIHLEEGEQAPAPDFSCRGSNLLGRRSEVGGRQI